MNILFSIKKSLRNGYYDRLKLFDGHRSAWIMRLQLLNSMHEGEQHNRKNEKKKIHKRKRKHHSKGNDHQGVIAN